MSEKTKIALASDHAGFTLKEKVREYLLRKGYEVEDLGPQSAERVDYPDFAEEVATRVARHDAPFGVLICGTGIGMAITANKIPGIRATPCNDTISARMARAHNDANILALGGRLIDEATARKVLDTWFSTPFEGGRHQQRLHKIDQIAHRFHTEKTK